MKSFIAAIAFVLLAAAPASAQPAPDHAEWDGLLSRYVVESADGINRVRYAAWKANSADHAALRAYIRALEAVSAADMARNDEFAFWVNLYNAITVDLVLDAYPVASIRDIGRPARLQAARVCPSPPGRIRSRTPCRNDLR
jgi:hypothetical protein